MTAASVHPPTRRWSRRARPLLGTLVEIGTPLDAASSRAVALGFGAIEEVQACLSRFENRSDIARFNAMDCGAILTMRAATAEALCAAADLRRLTAGLFDISLGTAVDGWQIDGERLVKRDARTRLDLGGIGKGLAVDRAVQALRDAGVADGWVNAGGDLRAFGAVELPLQLRDERSGGVRPFATLRDGAFATSHFGGTARAVLQVADASACDRPGPRAHVSVAAPCCLWADALTKVVAASGDTQHPLLRIHGASAWHH